MGTRRQGRELALQVLYQIDITGQKLSEAEKPFWEHSTVGSRTREFATQILKGTTENIKHIDKVISKYTENWDIKRMASVDRNILRGATFELIYLEDIPINVIINEAVELAKKYSTAESGRFVNGILDKIKKERKTKKAAK
ncbi:MAG: transcription antitermination factor NusB [bacterium]